MSGPMPTCHDPPPFRYVSARQSALIRRNPSLPSVPNRNINVDEARVLGFLALHRYRHPPNR